MCSDKPFLSGLDLHILGIMISEYHTYNGVRTYAWYVSFEAHICGFQLRYIPSKRSSTSNQGISSTSVKGYKTGNRQIHIRSKTHLVHGDVRHWEIQDISKNRGSWRNAHSPLHVHLASAFSGKIGNDQFTHQSRRNYVSREGWYLSSEYCYWSLFQMSTYSVH